MAQYLTLSRAARLVGVKRGTLQNKISSGELRTFEGMIELSDLLRVYPQTRVEDSSMLEHVDHIKRKTVPRSLRERSEVPDIETLTARLTQLSEELARTKTEANSYSQLVDQLQHRFDEVEQSANAAVASTVSALKQWFLDALDQRSRAAEVPQALLVRDTVLRLMAAHVHMFPSGHDFFVEGNDTILDAGLRAGYALNYGCSDGSCGQCKARLLAGKLKQTRLPAYTFSESERKQGYTLTCCNTAITDVELESREISTAVDIPVQTVAGKVYKIRRPSDDIAIVHIKTAAPARLRFLAGQHVALGVDGVPAGDFSIANCPCDDTYLEFHVARNAGSAFADYVFTRLDLADVVTIRGPKGNLTLDEESPRSLVLLAWDVGFAPIKSLAENAMALDVAESIHLYWVAPSADGHYYWNLCRSWMDALDNFSFTALTAAPGGGDDSGQAAAALERGAVEAVLNRVVEDHPELSSLDFYISAPAEVLRIAGPFLAARGLPAVQLSMEPTHQGDSGHLP